MSVSTISPNKFKRSATKVSPQNKKKKRRGSVKKDKKDVKTIQCITNNFLYIIYILV